MALNRCAYIILGIMQKKKAVNEMRGMTIYEIKELERISSRNTIYKRLQEVTLMKAQKLEKQRVTI